MLIITNDGEIKKACSSLTGKEVIGIISEPQDELGQFHKEIAHNIIPRIAVPESNEQLLSVLDSLHKHLHHGD